jgi:nucleotide-binding universal stress UspA family protein
MSKRAIMCAIDASDEADAVVWTGARLASLLAAPLVLLHVAREPGRRVLDSVLHPKRQADDPRAGRILLRHHAEAIPVTATVELATGVPADEVLDAADAVDPQLLVLGADDHRGLRALLGGVTRDVTRATTRPTMVVPRGAPGPLTGTGPVLCGVDDSEESARAAGAAAGVAAALGTDLVLAAVVDVAPAAATIAPAPIPPMPEPPEVTVERERAVRTRADLVARELAGDVTVRVVVDTGDPATRLTALARELDAVFVAIGSTDRSLITAALGGAVAPRLVGRASLPVLLVP